MIDAPFHVRHILLLMSDAISSGDREITSALERMRRMVLSRLCTTALARVPGEMESIIGGGKMLRARLTLRLGPAMSIPPEQAERVAAAVELVHAASLLHDDVIDGGEIRRGLPTFWRQHGTRAAILAGDLLLCQAYDLVREPFGPPRTARAMVDLTHEMCETEIEQELLLRGARATHEEAVRLARGKTGSLFAFAACGMNADEDGLAAALRKAGYLAGTAYQISDDILDISGNALASGKSLGSDARRGKVTAASVGAKEATWFLAWIERARVESAALLKDWPAVSEAWHTYWTRDLGPSMAANVSGARAPTAVAP